VEGDILSENKDVGVLFFKSTESYDVNEEFWVGGGDGGAQLKTAM
jgi:hypothetical protein